MSEIIKVNGACLCGEVKVQVDSMNGNVGACHCNMCRKWGGGPFLGIDCKIKVEITGKENVVAYSSSEWAERGFCSKCGTHLFYRLKQTGQHIMPVGLFDLDTQLNFDHQVFIDEKPSFYCFSNETKNMTGAEVFAAFSGESS